MIWTFYFCLFGIAFGAAILAEVWEQAEQNHKAKKRVKTSKEGARRK